ncbi:nucleotidyl transferase AbiEii/AbiGii toxin family protein [Xanthomonas arboricola]|uniref:Nucleotidyltransferase component of viral defense system n=1 Tax=Xanthomonas arboricola TaxID=56448 RepID=A0AB73H1R9_9XANT|nr:nucleotidyl transferase AbiEii/AbiGii toxin family protein [Xanthomonas arboricola]MBB5672335.1 putative nucleotidyltransferase component of viral defense system [Xanthomonas arboricola]
MRYSFEDLLKLAEEEAGGVDVPARSAIVKELLHYSILYGLSRSELSNAVTFQGGTSLRLARGGNRYSEDLDFVCGADAKEPFNLGDMEALLKEHALDRYGLTMDVVAPKAGPDREFNGENIAVKRWSFNVNVPGFVAKQKVHFEVVNVPCYEPEVVLLQPRYSFLSDIYSDVALRVESENEVLADKVVALVARSHLKGRDLWDLTWLQDKGKTIDFELVQKKFEDYGISDIADRIETCRGRLAADDAQAKFKAEMIRFVTPTLARQLDNPSFVGRYLSGASSVLDKVEQSLELRSGMRPS